MTRNLDRRIEVAAPVEAPEHRKGLLDLLELMWRDNRQAWDLKPDGGYVQRRAASAEEERATHRVLIDMYREGVKPQMADGR